MAEMANDSSHDPERLEAAFHRLLAAAEGLPEVAESITHGQRSLKVRNGFLGLVKDGDTVAVTCSLEEKAMLLDMAPEIYFEPDHYKGWPTILVRLSRISDEELRHRVERAYLMRAPKGLIKKWQAASAPR
jgi:hypothetical protein